MSVLREVAEAIKNITLIVTSLGLVITLVIKINKMKESVDNLPDLTETINTISNRIEEISKECKGTKTDVVNIKEELTKHCQEGEKKNALILDVARQILLNEIESSIHYGYVSANRRTVVGELYEAYRINGGNGPIHQMWDIYMDLPIEPLNDRR